MKALLALILFLPLISLAQEDGMDLIDNTKSVEKTTPEIRKEISRLGTLLDTLYSDCGRYPKTDEGLQALVVKPKTMTCKKWKGPYIPSVPKGYAYASEDGHAYKAKWAGTN